MKNNDSLYIGESKRLLIRYRSVIIFLFVIFHVDGNQKWAFKDWRFNLWDIDQLFTCDYFESV